MLLETGVYPYEYMDKWENFDETTLSEKEEFYSNFNMEQTAELQTQITCMWREFVKILK